MNIMTMEEMVREGLYEYDRAGEPELTTKGRQHFCKHGDGFLIRDYTMLGLPRSVVCKSCGFVHFIVPEEVPCP